MKLLTASLEGKALDWALAVALEKTPALSFERKVVVSDIMGWLRFDHADPVVCLGLIERHKLDVNYRDPLRLGDSVLVSWGDKGDFAYGYWSAHGKTLAEAVARCVVAMRLGDEVDAPDEICSMFIAMMLCGDQP